MVTDSAAIRGSISIDYRSAHATLRQFQGDMRSSAEMSEQSAAKIARAFDHVPGKVQAAAASTDKLASSSEKLAASGGRLESTFASATKSAAAFGVGMIGVTSAQAAVQMAFDTTIGSAARLETAVLNISTLKPEIDTSGVTSSIIDMSTRVAQSTSNLADSLYNIFSSIEVSQEDALQLTEEFARGAVAAQTNAETFGTAVIGVMNAYKLSTKDATHISDIFFNTINRGVVTGQQLASSLGPVTQSAKAAGVEIEELGAMIAAATKEGGQASENINNLNNLFQKITTQEAQAQINKLGVATIDAAGNFRPIQDILGDLKIRLEGMTEAARLNAIQKIFPDAQARIGAQTIISQLDLVNLAIEENKTQAGSADRAYQTMASGAEAQSKILLNNLSAIGTELGTATIPLLKEASDITVDFLKGFNEPEQGGGGAAGWLGRVLGEKAEEKIELLRNAKESLEALKGVFEGAAPAVENMTEAQSQSTQQFEAHGAVMQEVNAIAAESARATASAGVAAQTAGQQAATAVTGVDLLAQALGKTAEQAGKIADPLSAAMDRIDELAGRATAAEMTWNRQVTALDSVASSAQAMTTALNPEDLQRWADRAHEMADQSEATAPAIAQMHREIDTIAKGGPDAEAAMDRLNKTVDGAKAPYENAAAATRDYADAQGSAAKETLGIQGSIDGLKGVLTDFVEAFKVAIGQVPDSAKEAMRLTEEAVIIDLDAPGAESALSWAGGFEGKKTIVIQTAAGVAGAAKDELSFDASSFGANAAASFAAGLEAGISRVRVAAAMLASAAKVSTEQSIHAGSPSKDFIRYGGWASEGFAIGIERGTPDAVTASRSMGQASLDAIAGTLQLGSPSKLTMQYGEHFGGGFSVGIRNATGDVIASAEHLSFEALAQVEAAVNQFNRMVNAGAMSADTYDDYLGNLIGTVNNLHQGFGPILENFSRLATVPYEAAGAAHTVITTMRQAKIDTANLDLEIAKLNRELSYTDPYSDRAAAIKADIATLEAWKGQIQSGLDVLDAEAAALEASKTAWQGISEAREKYLADQSARSRFGSGADVSASLKTATGPEAGAEEGRQAFADLEAFIDDLLAKGGPKMQATAEQLRFLFWASFNLDTPEAREAARGQFNNVIAGLQTDAVAAVTFSSQTINSAITDSLFDNATIARIGAKAAALKAAIAEAMKLSGTPEAEQAIANVGQLIGDVETELVRLPASIRGPIREQYLAAVREFAAAPADPAVQSQLLAATTAVTNALAVFPQNLDAMRPEVREAAMRLFGEVEAGALTVDQARARLDGIISLIPNDIAKHAPEVQNAARQLAQAVEDGTIPAEEAVARLNGFIDTIPDALADIDPFVRQRLTNIANGFLDLGQDVHTASDQAAQGMREIERATASAARTANPALASIDTQIQQLILAFNAGAISAEEFAASMATLQAAAAGAAGAVGSAAGAAGGFGVPANQLTRAQRALGPGKNADTGAPSGDIQIPAGNEIAYALIYGPATPQLAQALQTHIEGITGANPQYASFLEETFGAPMGGENGRVLGGTSGAQRGGEARLAALVRRASNMGFAAAAHAIEGQYYSGQISLAEAIRRLEELIAGRGPLGTAVSRAEAAATALRGGGMAGAGQRAMFDGGGGPAIDIAPVVQRLDLLLAYFQGQGQGGRQPVTFNLNGRQVDAMAEGLMPGINGAYTASIRGDIRRS